MPTEQEVKIDFSPQLQVLEEEYKKETPDVATFAAAYRRLTEARLDLQRMVESVSERKKDSKEFKRLHARIAGQNATQLVEKLRTTGYFLKSETTIRDVFQRQGYRLLEQIRAGKRDDVYYGILRICVDLLGRSVLWWGLLVLLFGAISAVLGVFFALTEREIKRILAYSSVENVGIILMGIGVGMIGTATHQPTVALIGFLAALYHALNHSFFKGLLFLNTGSVDYRIHTRNLNEMGGLGRLMPWTALMFLIGGMSVAAIPPFNGFVSEWFTYQAFFTASNGQDFIVRVALPLCAALLALVGTLSAMVTIKMYGSAFAGPARSAAAGKASEVPGSMLIGMAFLAIGCIALGLGAPVVAPYLAEVVSSSLHVPLAAVAGGLWVYPADMIRGILSTPLIALLLLGLLTVPVVLIALYGGRQAGMRKVNDPWACGYGYSSRMSVTASNFDQPITLTFSGIYLLRFILQKPLEAIGAWTQRLKEGIARAEPLLEGIIKVPVTRTVDYLGQQIQALQMGDIRMYCLYIIVTLVILLIAVFK